MSNLTNFKSNFSGGGARPNLFECQIYFPSGVTGSQAAAKASTFLVKAASIPSSNLGLIEVPYRGRKLKVAGDRTFESWTVTVINDTDFKLRKAFEEWMNLINRHVSNTSNLPSGALSYYKNLTVKQLGRANSDTSLATYTFVDAYPTVISNIELNYETNDAVEEFTVEFNYQYWTNESVTS
jgi:hypothetical protein